MTRILVGQLRGEVAKLRALFERAAEERDAIAVAVAARALDRAIPPDQSPEVEAARKNLRATLGRLR